MVRFLAACQVERIQTEIQFSRTLVFGNQNCFQSLKERFIVDADCIEKLVNMELVIFYDGVYWVTYRQARHTREMKCAKQLMGGFTNKGTLELTPSYDVKI